MCACQDANSAYNCFTETFFDLFKQCFPYKRITKKKIKDKKWLSKGLLISIKHKNRLFRRYREKPYNEIRKLTYIRYRNKLTNIIRKAETNYYSNLLLNEKFSIQNLWKVYRHLMGKDDNKKATVLNKLINDNGVVTGNDGIANTFNKYFCTIGQKLAETFQVNDNYKKYLTSFFSNSMFLNPITEFELHKEITKLPTDKSPGYDEIPPKIVKKSALFILKPLTHIYNLSFLQGYVPEKLKLAKVVPIHKKNDIYHPENYCPISLLSVFNKL